MTLGAGRGEILRHFLARGLRLAATGLGVGLGAALLLTSLIRALLFDVSPTDPVTLSVVCGTIAAVAAIACLVPAWRATRARIRSWCSVACERQSGGVILKVLQPRCAGVP